MSAAFTLSSKSDAANALKVLHRGLGAAMRLLNLTASLQERERLERVLHLRRQTSPP